MKAKKKNNKSKKMGVAPIKFRQSLFWDVNPKTIDLKKHAPYLVERVVELGNDREANWLYHYYPHPLLRRIVKNSRALHPSSRALWNELLKK
ncbi:MAG: hypothetical protein A3C93_01275 [Candidatus Lloydbacteria bacterium RIFCSPHIGHO2_02_FULL_54_17]|uniref:DUF6922 domain-containing protein n=1 Tax=Candidatus Lloydbacteria bacterium RIFCSPHIGHO2_02_FULL_54_17 TaxID=1798664 RepID=A0A1G2DD38_9BACT|nr:MAG: hypothetical protein A2762_02070 [Candidatus Lloydbacteria bacterium RIFCSPHIGHO2_01_FULL_54_11]OGZ10708.1 MAG: hypothetical protein A3C93_01275 [Candidatus Lloydbacteria bacterium RIFCSPHIGHO2_02_FULL_54_17]OGZ12911.1 MAG: hypothetical protein A2948_00770 [Candidatus Lloydbacteria bacterium RIFCSPLOWO2_01_FULL_54_18]OGZ15343.1 MAG: hypothetical protein A3H76_06955 [Candidatus Lloydbacteria bacterium RIFCSPLOWO2_02_FULL_54_12]